MTPDGCSAPEAVDSHPDRFRCCTVEEARSDTGGKPWSTLACRTRWLRAAAVFHTQLAGRQLTIGELERSVNAERERFDELRYRRAELRSPVRLASAASDLGMVRGDAGTFVELDSWATARQLAAAGVIDDASRQIIIDTDPLEQFSDVKRVSAGQP